VLLSLKISTGDFTVKEEINLAFSITGISPPLYGGNLPTIHGSPTKKFMINIAGYTSHSGHDMASLWEEG
jgi:hypothetical protein